MSEYSELPDFEVLEAVSAEMDRIVGIETKASSPEKFFWLLPVSDRDFVDVLREAKSGIGVEGLRQFLLDRFGTLAGMKAATRTDADISSVDGDGSDRSPDA